MSRARTIATGALLGSAAAVLMVSAALANDGRGFGRHHDGGAFFMILPLLALLGVAALLVVLWRGRHLAPATPAAAPPSPVSPTFNAQAILADRLARGEISPDDYRAAITVLREGPPPPG